VIGLVSISSFTFGFVTAMAGEVSALEPRNWKEQVNGYVYASDGKTILSVLRGSESRVLVEFEDIAPVMRQAIVAVEDRRFYEHRGIDVRAIGRALWADIRHQRLVEGGSTITQQFVKNAWVQDQRTLARKVREAALAWQLEQDWETDRILAAYLNTIYFGNGAYGIHQAAKIYFDKAPADLTLPEAALLAGIPADPTNYDPVAQPVVARGRRDVVLQAMLDTGVITRADYLAAREAALPDPDEVHLGGTLGAGAPYFTNYVREQLVDTYGATEVYGRGLRVRTTIDLKLQTLAREAIAKWLDEPDGPTAALVALDAKTGSVLAMVGGRNYGESQFNLAVQGQRQAGSSFKPFVLAAALEQGIAPVTSFVSEPVVISLGDRDWVVHNYEESYLGSISLEQATIHSDNAVYAELTRLVRPSGVVRMAKRLGITSPLENYFSIGLGAQASNPLELARGFSAFANGGFRIDTELTGNRPRAVEEVRDRDGKLLDANRPLRKRALRPDSAAIVTSLLQKAVEQGTGRRAMIPGFAVAGKTGTTENHGDAWFVGYTSGLVAAVWVGYPNKTVPMETQFNGDPVAGGTYPALIWKAFMQDALAELEREPELFAAPSAASLESRLVVDRDGRLQLDNGLCRERFEVVYFAGFAPRRTADCKPNEVEVPNVVGKTLDDAEARLAAQPLTPVLVYKPALPRQRLDIVLSQIPVKGRLSSFDEVKLVLAKPLHGVVPNVRGLSLAQARARLLRLRLEPVLVGGSDGRVASQRPRAGVAAEPGMRVELALQGERQAAGRSGLDR
jgi:penicillin-binding protein 1A